MDVEKILNRTGYFQNLKLDTILFESKYPVLFTASDEKKIYLFICCLVNAAGAKWIGTETDYGILIKLLKNQLTIRDSFLAGAKKKLMAEFSAETGKTTCIPTEIRDIPGAFLPTKGEYMDAEDGEYAEEIAVFTRRSKLEEYQIRRLEKSYISLRYKRAAIPLPEPVRERETREQDCVVFYLDFSLKEPVIYVQR